MCTYVCNMHSLLMHTGYTVISTANLNLLTKHTLATTVRFSFSPGEKTLVFLPFFLIYFNNILCPFPPRNYKFISFEVKTSQTRSRPIIAELIRKFRNTRRSDSARIFPICPERIHFVDDVLFSFVLNFKNYYFILLHFFINFL